MEVLSVNISEKKGTVKHAVNEIIISKDGIKNDAHAGNWHRQISMLGTESVHRFEKQAGRKIAFGEFAENITTKGIELVHTAPLDMFIINDVELQVTQIGKKCHGEKCAIYKEVGNCVMPKEGIFCRVIKPGKIKAGDSFSYTPKTIQLHVITLSDRASRGEYEDLSGPIIQKFATKFLSTTKWKYKISSSIIPDDANQLEKTITKLTKNKTDIIITTGGTGISKRDITPEVVKSLLDKEIPGIMEMIRMKYGNNKPNALLSRSTCGIIDESLIYCLPGSVKAVNEYCNEIFKTTEHLLFMLHGLDAH